MGNSRLQDQELDTLRENWGEDSNGKRETAL